MVCNRRRIPGCPCGRGSSPPPSALEGDSAGGPPTRLLTGGASRRGVRALLLSQRRMHTPCPSWAGATWRPGSAVNRRLRHRGFDSLPAHPLAHRHEEGSTQQVHGALAQSGRGVGMRCRMFWVRVPGALRKKTPAPVAQLGRGARFRVVMLRVRFPPGARTSHGGQDGKATDCNPVTAGSSPARASTHLIPARRSSHHSSSVSVS